MIDPVGGSVSIMFPLFSVTTNGSITNMLSEQHSSEHELNKYITKIRNLLTDNSQYLSLIYLNDTFKES